MAQRFKFSLQTLLRVRELREREARRKVAQKRADIARLDALDDQARQQILEQQQLQRAAQEAGRVDTAELARRRSWVAYLRRTMLERRAARDALHAQLQMLLAELRTAHVDLRVLEKLREKRWEQFRRARNLREQNQAEELVHSLPANRSPDDPKAALIASGMKLVGAWTARHDSNAWETKLQTQDRAD